MKYFVRLGEQLFLSRTGSEVRTFSRAARFKTRRDAERAIKRAGLDLDFCCVDTTDSMS